MVQRGNDELGLYIDKGEDGGFRRCLNVKSTESGDGINMVGWGRGGERLKCQR